MTPSVRRLALLAVAAVAAVGCDFQPDPAQGPSALGRRESGQPSGSSTASRTAAQNATPDRCVDLVFFFGSWMHAGEEIPLDIVPRLARLGGDRQRSAGQLASRRSSRTSSGSSTLTSRTRPRAGSRPPGSSWGDRS